MLRIICGCGVVKWPIRWNLCLRLEGVRAMSRERGHMPIHYVHGEGLVLNLYNVSFPRYYLQYSRYLVNTTSSPPRPHKYPCSCASARCAVGTRRRLPSLAGAVDVGGSFTGLGDGVCRTRGLSGVRIGRRRGAWLWCCLRCGHWNLWQRLPRYLNLSLFPGNLCVYLLLLLYLLTTWHRYRFLLDILAVRSCGQRLEVAVEVAVLIHSLAVCCTVLCQDRRLDTTP
jgi:hypothetical protein